MAKNSAYLFGIKAYHLEYGNYTTLHMFTCVHIYIYIYINIYIYIYIRTYTVYIHTYVHLSFDPLMTGNALPSINIRE